VFVVGHLGDWRRAAAVLFERESLSGHPAPRRTTWQDVAGTIGGSSQSGGFRTTDLDNSGAFIPEIVPQAMSAKWAKGSSGPAGDEVANLIASTLGAEMGRNRGLGNENELGLIAFDTTQITHPENRSNPQPGGPAPPLAAAAHAPGVAYPAIAFEPRVVSGRRGGTIRDTVGPLTKESDRGDGFPCVAFSAKDYGNDATDDLAPTLRSGNEVNSHANGGVPPAVAFAELADPIAANQGRTYTREGSGNFRLSNVAHTAMQVRRLTPRECERLQGFPDDYTLIRYRGKPAADGPRYKALGNSMAVPVMRWIGERIAAVELIEDR
jgi:DNA (cytosine-5)-methyltransferase 1